jgi:hypothetical protein
MKLFLVRHIDDKQAVGIVVAESLADLIDAVDIASNPDLCEYVELRSSGALLWEGHAPAIGTEPPDDIDQHFKSLFRGITPAGSLEEPFYDGVPEVEWMPLIRSDFPRTIGEFARIKAKQAKAAARAERQKLAERAAEEKAKRAEKIASLVIPTNVYFIGCEGNVKIGIANSIEGRLKTLATGHYNELTLLAVVKDAPGTLEYELHQRFAAHRLRGEWFRLVPEIQAYIDEVNNRT